jgi:outer membrane protein TolC
VENERTRRRLGLVTLIDVINFEDRLTDALAAEVQARQAYANAIAQLRFDLGTIVIERDGQFDVPVEDLFNPTFDIAR